MRAYSIPKQTRGEASEHLALFPGTQSTRKSAIEVAVPPACIPWPRVSWSLRVFSGLVERLSSSHLCCWGPADTRPDHPSDTSANAQWDADASAVQQPVLCHYQSRSWPLGFMAIDRCCTTRWSLTGCHCRNLCPPVVYLPCITATGHHCGCVRSPLL